MKLRPRLWGSVATLLAAAATVPAFAQVVTTGTVTVVVEAQDGSRLPGAVVTAASTDAFSRREATTDAAGEARLSGLEPSAKYVVTVAMSGFSSVKQERILVRSGQTTSLKFSLSVSQQAEEITVTADTPVVDVTNATTGQDITLQLTESLPTGRSYQSYLQLVPGVLPDNPSSPGNPASKSGLNYADIGGEAGISRDNFYYIDGINVTDGVTGTFGANLNTEIIQEQKVLTGGIPAEYIGAPGLLSSVITKAGSNTFHGSVNYFFQNDGLVSENKNFADSDFSTYDTAFTLGGPIVKDRAWFFGSYRRLNRKDDVVTADTRQLIRSVERIDDQFYGKATWSPTSKDTVSFTFLNDPADLDGSRDRTRTNARNFARKQGGNNYKASYSRLLGPLFADFSWARHNGEVSDFSAIREELNTVIFRRTDVRTLADEQLGGFGIDAIDQRDTDLYKAAFQWDLDRHTLKFGAELTRNSNFRNRTQIGDAEYTGSLQNGLSGITAGELATGSFTARLFNPLNVSDFTGFINTVNALPNRAAFYAAFDTNRDGVISAAELAASLRFSSTAGNPHGRINYSRTAQTADGPQETKSEGLSFFLQDSAQFGRLNVNAGVRAERFEHFATTGENIFTFDWTFAPRVSLVYDLKGDGKQKLSAYYGKYYDPIRNNLTNFAGTLTGAIREEQVFALGQWVTYRTRGGPVVQDAFFAPTTKTPWTDDLQVGYAVDLGKSMSFEATYTKRRTRDIIEDYDLALFALNTAGGTDYPGPINHPDSLWLGLDYFGYSQNPGSNFVIATLADGKRDYQGMEFVFRKRYADNWQALVSYTFNDADGNTNSDSNADFQGDVLFLDPGAPNSFGRQPGSIRHLFKVAGSYDFPMGLRIGGTYNWNSGTIASKTFSASRRNLPIEVSTPFAFAGITDFWLAPDAIGSLTNPSFGIFDLRVQYLRKFGQVQGEFFVDVFNVFNNQDAIRNQDLVAGAGGVAFGQGLLFSDPRRFYLGARLSF